jgi:glycosyltransferase involved in cell wall biosynthesis
MEYNVISRRQGLEHRQAGRHAGTKGDGFDPAFQIGQALFKRMAVRIVDPAVEVMPGKRPVRITLKGGGSVKRGGDRAGERIHLPPGVNADGLKCSVQRFLVRRLTHCLSLVRSYYGMKPEASSCTTLCDAGVSDRLLMETVVAIPVRDEAKRIGNCLAALSHQSVPPDHVVLLLNNCTDGTADVVQSIPEAAHRLHIIERKLAGSSANAGVARALAMEHAASLIKGGVLLTTDADGEVPPDWIELNLEAVEEGADAVCGRAVIDPIEALLIPQHLHDDDAREVAYGQILDQIRSIIVPDPADPWPRHQEDSGASLAITKTMFRRIGGVPRMPSGEDRALIESLRMIDGCVRHDPRISVVVSGRIEGRAGGGMADTIRRRIIQQDEFVDDRIEPAWRAFRRMMLKSHFGLLRHEPAGLHEFAKLLGVAPAFMAEAVAARHFGTGWSQVEKASSLLSPRRVRFADLPREMEIAQGILSLVFNRYMTELAAA